MAPVDLGDGGGGAREDRGIGFQPRLHGVRPVGQQRELGVLLGVGEVVAFELAREHHAAAAAGQQRRHHHQHAMIGWDAVRERETR